MRLTWSHILLVLGRLATLLGRVSLFKKICSKMKSKNIKFLVLICVKVGGSGFYSEVLTPTRCFVKKESGPGAILVNIAIIKNGVICVVKPFQ